MDNREIRRASYLLLLIKLADDMIQRHRYRIDNRPAVGLVGDRRFAPQYQRHDRKVRCLPDQFWRSRSKSIVGRTLPVRERTGNSDERVTPGKVETTLHPFWAVGHRVASTSDILAVC